MRPGGDALVYVIQYKLDSSSPPSFLISKAVVVFSSSFCPQILLARFLLPASFSLVKNLRGVSPRRLAFSRRLLTKIMKLDEMSLVDARDLKIRARDSY